MNVVGTDSSLNNKSLFNPPNTANQHVEVFKKTNFERSGRSGTKEKYKSPPYPRRYCIEQLEDRNNTIVQPAEVWSF